MGEGEELEGRSAECLNLPPPNFDALYTDEHRLTSNSYERLTNQIQHHVYDHARQREFRVEYPAPDNSDNHARDLPYGEGTNPLEDAFPYADTMGDDNVLRLVEGKWTHFRDESYLCPTPLLESRGDFPLSAATVLQPDLEVTGAIYRQIYVVGHWKAIFKVITLWEDVQRRGNEIRTMLALKSHQHVVPLLQIVVNKDDKVVGFTMPFYPKGNWTDQKSVKAKWVAQLMMVVDDLSLRLVLRLHICGDIFSLVLSDTRYTTGILDHITLCDHFTTPSRPCFDVTFVQFIDELDNIRLADFEYALVEGKDPLRNADMSIRAEGALVVSSLFHVFTEFEYPEIDDPTLTLMEDRFILRAQMLMDRPWVCVVETDVTVDEAKRALALWMKMRVRPGYHWSDFVLRFTATESAPDSKLCEATLATILSWEALGKASIDCAKDEN